MDNIEVIILILQLLLIGGQLYLAYKINNQNLSKNKGYFVLDSSHRFYNLRDKLNFTAVGENDIIVTGTTIEVDGATKESDSIPREIFFTKNGGFNSCDIRVPFSENELKRDDVTIKIGFHLKNPQEYVYREILTMKFIKVKETTDAWEIVKFNLEFSK